MATTLEVLFYVVVLVGVVGCFVYLIAQRRRKEVPKRPLRLASKAAARSRVPASVIYLRRDPS